MRPAHVLARARAVAASALSPLLARRAAMAREDAADTGASRFRRVFACAPVGTALVTGAGRTMQVNDALCALLETTPAALAGRELAELVEPDDVDRLRAALRSLDDGSTTPVRLEAGLRIDDTRVVWCTLDAWPFDSGRAGPRVLVVQARDATARRITHTDLHHVAYHDGLTALPNRAHFDVLLRRAVDASNAPHPRAFAVMYLDFDRFKAINDSLGHRAGDVFLATVAARLQACLRGRDVVARLGGDEFAVLLELADPQAALELAARMLAAIAQPVRLGAVEVTTSASIGITFSAIGYDNGEDVLRDADLAMYKAKADGKARYAVFDTSLHERASAQVRFESDLRRALSDDQLVVQYQPLFDLRTLRLRGFEALVRWTHPERGLVDPGRFVAVAEEAGLIVALGEAVFEKACRQLQAWTVVAPDAGPPTGLAPLTMNVNVSAIQLAHPGFVARVACTLARHDIAPGRIHFEVTESALMDAVGVVPVLQHLADLGIRLSIDDFGTGYSSLSRLHSLPFDTLKIDRSFVERMTADGEGQEVVRSIVALARALGKTVIAEGIETRVQLQQLRALDCEEGQGYYFSKALSAGDITPMLAVWRDALRPKPTTPCEACEAAMHA